jgi:hypothetical protein
MKMMLEKDNHWLVPFCMEGNHVYLRYDAAPVAGDIQIHAKWFHGLQTLRVIGSIT